MSKKIEVWFTQNSVPLNVNTTENIIFTNKAVSADDKKYITIKFFRITLEYKLKWVTHIIFFN